MSLKSFVTSFSLLTILLGVGSAANALCISTYTKITNIPPYARLASLYKPTGPRECDLKADGPNRLSSTKTSPVAKFSSYTFSPDGRHIDLKSRKTSTIYKIKPAIDGHQYFSFESVI